MKRLIIFLFLVFTSHVYAADSIYYPVKTQAANYNYPNIKFIFSPFENAPGVTSAKYKCEIYPQSFPGWTTDEDVWGTLLDDGVVKKYCLVLGYLPGGPEYFVMRVKLVDSNGNVLAATAPFTVRALLGVTETHPAKVLY